jgi:HK97 family phage prohead protease
MFLTRTTDGTEVGTFDFGFNLDQKAVVTENDDGSFFIEGLASDFNVDRQDEAFEPGAFEQGMKAYMASNPILLYHHKYDTALGQVVAARIDDAGLHVKARVDAPEPGTMIADYVRKIKKGTLRAFSVGGKFYRRMTENGPRIFKADVGEISVTPFPVNGNALFAVAGKAFESPTDAQLLDSTPDELAQLARDMEALEEELDAYEGKAVKKKTSTSGSTPQSGVAAAKRVPGQGHPDSGKVAALLAHVQKIHTLAENTAQNAADPEVAAVADKAAKSLRKHSSNLHTIAARIGPLPDYYGPLA